MKKHLLSLFLFATFLSANVSAEVPVFPLTKAVNSNATKSSSRFFLRMLGDVGENLDVSDKVSLELTIFPELDDIGQSVDLYHAALIANKWWMLNSQGEYEPWNISLKNLVPFQEDVELDFKNIKTPINANLNFSGEARFFFAYARSDKNYLTATPQAFRFSVSGKPSDESSITLNTPPFISKSSFDNRSSILWTDYNKLREPLSDLYREKYNSIAWRPHARVFLDIDLDGDDDIFTAGLYFDVDGVMDKESLKRIPGELWINDGFGNFSLDDGKIIPDMPTFVHSRKAVTADFNSDGYPDIVVADHGWDYAPFDGDNLALILSDGNGKYSHEVIDGPKFFHGVAAGDFDTDGDVDLVSMTGYFYINDGQGNFTVEPLSDIPNNWDQIYNVVAFDLDNNGQDDFVSLGDSWITVPQIRFNENGNFFVVDLPFPNNTYQRLLDAGYMDVNQDGVNDIILNLTGGDEADDLYYKGRAIYAVIMNRNKTVQQLVEIYKDAEHEKEWIDFIRVEDINSDGFKDIFSENKYDGLLLINDGNGIFEEKFSCMAPSEKVYHVEHIDINDDGLVDKVTSGHTWITPTTVTYSSTDRFAAKGGCNEELPVVEGFETTTRMALEDMDGDGSIDIVLAQTQREDDGFSPKFEGYALVIYYLTKDGKYKDFEKVAENLDIEDYMQFISLEDLNDDGVPDIRARVGDDSMSFINGVDFNL